ncbi:hypothetical protein Hypma_004232 [Hypsizygus marmoreus]|uniref:Uncharacterized protein n=1 Tax=Hypsizygus marmoreus TaxID=39966 RepID=A0A369J2R4_HYPMA|nr:hypothetical protein Hypma_004232 [Hypsizygus marmoreus]
MLRGKPPSSPFSMLEKRGNESGIARTLVRATRVTQSSSSSSSSSSTTQRWLLLQPSKLIRSFSVHDDDAYPTATTTTLLPWNRDARRSFETGDPWSGIPARAGLHPPLPHPATPPLRPNGRHRPFPVPRSRSRRAHRATWRQPVGTPATSPTRQQQDASLRALLTCMDHVIVLVTPDASTPPQRQPTATQCQAPTLILRLARTAPHIAHSVLQRSAPGSLEDGSVLLAAAPAPLHMVGPARFPLPPRRY